MERVVYEIFTQIKHISPNHMHLLWFWHVKNAEVDTNWADHDAQKDSYDRQDNFNVIGLATYLFFTAKQAICSITGTNSILQEYA